MAPTLAANDIHYGVGRCRTNPLPGSMRRVPGYPDKLRIYLTAASPFWQVRCFFRGRMRTRSLRTSDARSALRGAQSFYEELTASLAAPPAPRQQSMTTFGAIAERLLASERSRTQRGEFSAGSLQMLEAQLRRQVLPVLGDLPAAEVSYAKIEAFVQSLSARGLRPATIHHYLISVRKVLRHAVALQLLATIPSLPTVRVRAAPRGGFALAEYRVLVKAARAGRRAFPGGALHSQLSLLVRFMVNSFVRPHDIKLLQHKHVEVVRGPSTYLRLVLPETKRKTAPVVTMAAAVGIYERLRRAAGARRCRPEDYVFLPEVQRRGAAMWTMDQQFRRLLEGVGLRKGSLGQARTLYSLRHTAIMLRLLYGKGIDLLTLARNARTSVAMIERFYAANLTAEMNIGLLHSRRARGE